MKKSSKSLDISLQHKNEASYKFSKKKKKLLHLAEKGAGAQGVNDKLTTITNDDKPINGSFLWQYIF